MEDMYNNDGFCLITGEPIINCAHIVKCADCGIANQYREIKHTEYSLNDSFENISKVSPTCIGTNANEMKEAVTFINYEDLTKSGLIFLINHYDQYIKDIVEEGDFKDRVPVCIHEYLNNDIKGDIECENGALYFKADTLEVVSNIIDAFEEVL